MWFLCGPNNYSSDILMLFVHNNYKYLALFIPLRLKTVVQIFLNK